MAKRNIMTLEDIKSYFGNFQYRELTGGWIEIFGNFEDSKLVKTAFGFVNAPRRVHKSILPAVFKALHVIERNAQWQVEYEYIEDMQFYAPRHIAYDKKRRLSSHAWGIAFDINPWENMPGCSDPKIPAVIVDVFEHVGFFWGGRFSNKDYMHFEPRTDFFDFKDRWQ